MADEVAVAEKKSWDVAWINKLPNEAFAIVLEGGEKDESGLTVPRSLRKLPHHGPSVKDAADNESVDLPHLRNALARESQTDMPGADHRKARSHLERHAKALLPSYEKALHKDVSYSDVLSALGRFLMDDLEVDEDSATPEPHLRYDVHDIFRDSVVLRGKDDTLYQLPYTTEGSEVVFNWEELQPVVMEFVPRQSFRSYKSADGKWHWATWTASSFRDREDEIISNKALDSGVAHSDTVGERGPLRLYHVKGADVGVCRAQARVGNFLVEAGDWDDTALAVAARTWVENHSDDAGVSIGFKFNPANKVDGVYGGPIEIIERSLLNVRDAACPWTKLWDAPTEEKMGTKQQVAEIVGEVLADEVFTKAEKQTDDLVAEGVAFKTTTEEVAAPEPTPVEEIKETPAEPIVEVKEELPLPAAVTEVEPSPDPAMLKGMADLRDLLTTLAVQVQDIASRQEKVEGALGSLSTAQQQLVKEWVGNLPRSALLNATSDRATQNGGLEQAKVDSPDAETKAKAGNAGRGFFDVPLADSIQEILKARQ